MHRRMIEAILFVVCLSLLLSGCGEPAPQPEDDLVAATSEEIASQVAELLGSELQSYEVSLSQVHSDGSFGRVEAQIVLEVCPYFQYELRYNAQREEGRWVLYNEGESLPNLFKRWAMAQSAARAGESIDVPGSQGQRQVALIPHGMPELLRARLEGFSNATVDPLVGFFVCLEGEILWDEIDPELEDELRELIPQVRDAMGETMAQQIGEP